jgi:hypothetical protein
MRVGFGTCRTSRNSKMATINSQVPYENLATFEEEWPSSKIAMKMSN